MDTGKDPAQATLEHAWRYFELHANQRMSVFNFFTVLAGLNVAGLGATFQGNSRFGLLALLLGLVLVLLSFVFWKLDQRAAFLVKHAENALKVVEEQMIEPAGRLFLEEPNKTAEHVKAGPVVGIWTFGRSLRVTFVVMALIGIVGAGLALLRSLEVISFEGPTGLTQQQEVLAPTLSSRRSERMQQDFTGSTSLA